MRNALYKSKHYTREISRIARVIRQSRRLNRKKRTMLIFTIIAIILGVVTIVAGFISALMNMKNGYQFKNHINAMIIIVIGMAVLSVSVVLGVFTVLSK